jgi:hypothetical protein
MMLGFRVWDTENYEFCENTDQEFYIDRIGYLYELYKRSLIKHKGTRYIPMQSTGIYDWQDKPIYEGDVLFLYRKTGNNIYYLVENIKDFLIIYGQDYYNIEKISNDGNIYECPALLERVKNDNTDEL